MRRSLATQTGLAVLLWFFSIPFLHLHVAEAEHSHDSDARMDGSAVHDEDSAVVHFHLPAHHAAGAPLELSAADEHETPLRPCAIVQKHTAMPPPVYLVALRVEPLPAMDRSPDPIVAIHTPRAHDPPDSQPAIPRAPPA